MINEFHGIGNLGTTPSLQNVALNGENQTVANMRVYFDRPVRQEDGSYKNNGGFWMSVSIWDRCAEDVVRTLSKGTRVYVRGQIREHPWIDKDTGEERSEQQLIADYIFIDPLCIDSIHYKSRKPETTEAEGNE